MDADAVIVTWDLIDYNETAVDKPNGEMVGNQVEQFKSLYDLCPVPLHLTLGNHDITTYWIDEKDSSKMQTQAYIIIQMILMLVKKQLMNGNRIFADSN